MTPFPQFCTHPVKIIPIRDRQMIGEYPILVHKVKLISRQKHDQNELHFQLGHLHPHAGVPTSSPTEERIGGVRNRVGSKPPTGIVLVRFRVVFRVQVDLAQGIREEIPPLDYPAADFHLLAKVPSKGGTSNGDSLCLSGAGVNGRELFFPHRDGDGSELLAQSPRGGVAEVTGKYVLNLLLALLFPFWVDRDVDERPARLFR